MHQWGDTDFDWESLHLATNYLDTFMLKYGRIRISCTEEKYGTVRIYCVLGVYQLHSLTHPQYTYSQYPTWLWNLDCKYISKIFNLRPIRWITFKYQAFIYRLAYKNAVKKWPKLKEEILCCADYDELLVNI